MDIGTIHRWLLRLAGVALTITVLQGCANTTSSGAIGLQRSQLLLVSSDTVNAQAAKGFQQLTADAQKKQKLNTDRAMTQRVRRIGNDLIAQVGVFRPDARNWAWEINVFESDQINAFCAPGGKIGVYTGIVNQLKLTDDEIAAVMGHEIAHALREHSREQLSQKTVSSLLTSVVSAAAGVPGELMDAGSQMLVHLPNSRSMELESDIIGLELMARAGYDPRNASSIWKKMQQLSSGKGGPAFLSTHPAGADRIKELEAYVPKVLPLYEAALAQRNTPRSRPR
ncbi:M48 family metallopeptidase [Comamonas sp. NoAH]|uniref:M48 family metallopeptidase n=1 Tax=Comamonas halotolerans TaxID=3041496 RepID=UPI0024E11860|nr:M48 family metallopeptidase [Comamonas sp. NoAH]